MGYDYDRRSLVAAAKHPQIIPVNRLMGRGKPAVAKFLSDETGQEWKPSSYVKEWFNTVDFRWNGPYTEGVSWSVDVHISWNDRAGNYEVRTTASKGQRSVGFARVEGLALEDLKNPKKIIPDSVIADLKTAMAGSYDKEMGQAKEQASEMLDKAKEAHKLAEEISALVKDDAIGNFPSIDKRVREFGYLASSMDGSARTMKDILETIKSGK